MAEEIFDVCNDNDEVVGQLPRSEVHRRGLLHRAVHIWVFRPDGRLMVHRRATTKDEHPLCYTSSASGHLAAGEDYETAAHRELEEELGLRGELAFVCKLAAIPETANEHTVLYELFSDAEPTPDPGEIESIHYFTPAELDHEVTQNWRAFTPPFCQLWHWYMQHRRQLPTAY